MIRRVGRPGLLGTMARTAVVAGTATAVNRSMNRAAANREQTQADAQAHREEQAQPAPAAAPAPAASGDDVIEKLNRLGQLHDSGVLTDAEFTAAKAKLLA